MPGRPLHHRLQDSQERSITHDLVLVADDGELTTHRNVLGLESPVIERHCFGSIQPAMRDGKAVMQIAAPIDLIRVFVGRAATAGLRRSAPMMHSLSCRWLMSYKRTS